MKIKYKITTLCLTFVMVVGILFAGSTSDVSAASDPANAPVDWAFEASSVELNDAIVAKYPVIDTNGDGFISVSEANAYAGSIDFLNAGIGGTIYGIENFIQATELILELNNFTGTIPTNIGNMTGLDKLLIHSNNLTGTIPSSIGNLTSLKALYLGAQNLTGELPIELGNLHQLERIAINNTNISGSIPVEYNNLTALTYIYFQDANLSGEVSQGFLDLPNVIKVSFARNTGLTGNTSTGYATNMVLGYLDVSGTGMIQASPNIPSLEVANGGEFIYDNLADELLADSKTSLADGVTQETIDKAQESADFIADPTEKQQWQDDIDLAQKMLDAKNKVDTLLVTPDLNDLKPGITINDVDDAQDLVTALPNGTLKDELQAKIDTAKDLLDAKDKVDGLLTKPDLANLQDGVNKGIIDEAQNAVNKLPNGDLKDELQKQVDTANNLLDAKKKAEGLLNPDGSLVVDVDQGKIDEAQKAVNKLPNGTTKTALQKIIDDAQKQFNLKNEINKASISGGDIASGSAVSTGDLTNLIALLAMLGMSLLGLLVITKKSEE